MLSFFEILINNALKFDARTPSILEKLNGKKLKIIITDLDFFFHLNVFELRYKDNGICLEKSTKEAFADATVSGPMNAYLSLGLWKDPKFATNLGLKVEGDTEFANDSQNLFLNLDIDWEEALSKVTGDTIAHQLGNFARKTREKQKEIFDNFSLSFSNYVQEEARILPTPVEIQEFMQGVDVVHNEVERLEKRIELLEQYE
jgi:ubiquinone biosynthesis protein UbiJ